MRKRWRMLKKKLENIVWFVKFRGFFEKCMVTCFKKYDEETVLSPS